MYFDGVLWRYKDNGAPTATTWRGRACGHCGEFSTAEDHDHCLGDLPGVINACCGHGEIAAAYVQLCDGSILTGDEAVTFFNEATPSA